MNNNDKLKTGTTTVGIICKDGLVMAADRRATAGNYIVDKAVTKVVKINDDIVLTMAGVVSDAQLLIKLIRSELQLRLLKTNRKPTMKETANLLSGMVYNNVRSTGGITHFLIGGKDTAGYHMYDIFMDGSMTEIRDFVSSGSGSVITWGVLESDYTEDLSIEDGVKLVTKSINAALKRDSASGNGVTIYTITEKGVTKEVDKLIGADL